MVAKRRYLANGPILELVGGGRAQVMANDFGESGPSVVFVELETFTGMTGPCLTVADIEALYEAVVADRVGRQA